MLIFTGLCFSLFGCKNEELAPKPIIQSSNSEYSIYLDESIKIEPKILIEGQASYLWTEIDKELGKEDFLEYSTTKIGKHIVSLSVSNKAGIAKQDYIVQVNKIPTAEINTKIGEEGITLKNGEERTISPEVKSIRTCTFQWEENKKILGTDKDYKYSSNITGKHKLVFKATNIGGTSIDTIKINVSPIPLPIIKINIPEGGFSTCQGKELSFSADIISAKETTLSWRLDEKIISREKEFSYLFKNKGEKTIVLEVINEAGKSKKDIKVNISASYYYGMFMLNEGNMSNETGIVSFISRDGIKIDSVFQKANNGKKLGNVTQDMWISNNNIYFVSQNGPENIIIVDRYTLKQKGTITSGFENNTWPTHIAVTKNEEKAYVRGNGGLSIVDLNSMRVTGKVTDTGAGKQRMQLVDNKIYLADGNTLRILDTNSNKIIQSYELGSIGGISKGKDHCIWVGAGNKIVKINSGSLEIEKEYNMPDGYKFGCGWAGSTGLCANHNNNILYWKQGTEIRKFDSANEKASILANVKDKLPNAKMIYGVPSINPNTNEVYYGYIKGYGMDYLINGIGSVDGTTGATVHHYKNCVRFSVGAFFTSNFDY